MDLVETIWSGRTEFHQMVTGFILICRTIRFSRTVYSQPHNKTNRVLIARFYRRGCCHHQPPACKCAKCCWLYFRSWRHSPRKSPRRHLFYHDQHGWRSTAIRFIKRDLRVGLARDCGQGIWTSRLNATLALIRKLLLVLLSRGTNYIHIRNQRNLYLTQVPL